MDVVLTELLAVLRAAGVPASPVEAIDATRAAMAVGLDSRADLKAALRAVVVKDVEHALLFDRAFDAFFAVAPASATARPAVALDARERAALEAAIAAAGEAASGGGSGLATLADDPEGLGELLRRSARRAGVDRIQSSLQVGYFTQRVLEDFGASAMRRALGAARPELVRRLGEGGEALAARLGRALDDLRPAARAVVVNELARRSTGALERFRRRRLFTTDFRDLSPTDTARVAAEVRRMADRLRGRLSVRRKRRRRGKLDPRRTLRAAFRTGGVPFRPVLRRRRRDRPKLVLLCDVSDSVRFAARFLLVLVHAIQEAFSRTRSFVFVREIGEATHLFDAHPVERAIELAWGGAATHVASNSDYGHAFDAFASRHLGAVDRWTTVVVLGDGRTNFLDPRPQAFAEVRRRARRVLWLNPEPVSSWGFGDSAMGEWLPYCDEALTVHDLDTLRAAVDRLLARALETR